MTTIANICKATLVDNGIPELPDTGYFSDAETYIAIVDKANTLVKGLETGNLNSTAKGHIKKFYDDAKAKVTDKRKPSFDRFKTTVASKGIAV